MATMKKIGNHATNIRHENGKTILRYHSTDVVAVSGHNVTLDSGGWRSATTKTRMNQAANQWGLDFHVFQKNGEWFVMTEQATFPFYDGMTFEISAD